MNRPRLSQLPSTREERIAEALVRVAALVRSGAQATGSEHGVSATQLRILELLAHRRDPMTLGEIAAALNVKAPTASDAVTTLEEKGLVTKERALPDRRALAVALTAQGQRVAGQTQDWTSFLARAVDALGTAERDTLLLALVKLIRVIQEEGHASTARMCVDCRHFRPHAHAGADKPHHCMLSDSAFGTGDFQVDCATHNRAPTPQRNRNWLALLAGPANKPNDE